MNIAIIGIGNIGSRMARSWAVRGHRLFLGTSNPNSKKIKDLNTINPDKISVHSYADAVKDAEAVLMSVPAKAAFTVAKELGDLSDKIVIDAMNSVFGKPDPYERTSDAIREATGCKRIVKCFNTIGAENMDNPIYGDERADMFLCGGEEEDKQIVAGLAEDIGFNIYDLGGLELETVTENIAKFWGALAHNTGLGRNIAFKVLRR